MASYIQQDEPADPETVVSSISTKMRSSKLEETDEYQANAGNIRTGTRDIKDIEQHSDAGFSGSTKDNKLPNEENLLGNVDVFEQREENHSSTSAIDEDDAITEPATAVPQFRLRRTSSSLSVKTYTLPKVNCPEKIFFCVDHSTEMFVNKFQTHSTNQIPIFKTLTNVIKQFVCTKSFIDKRHEYSLVMLNEDTQLITDFTSNYEEILFMLNDIADSPPEESIQKTEDAEKSEFDSSLIFDLSSLFKVIRDQAELPRYNPKQPPKFPPPYIVRVIFIYGRSDCRVRFLNGRTNLNALERSPFFYIDAVYIHDQPKESNCVEDIFTSICAFDSRGSSHIHELGTDSNMASLYNIFAKLIAHPLQRPKQGDSLITYNLEED